MEKFSLFSFRNQMSIGKQKNRSMTFEKNSTSMMSNKEKTPHRFLIDRRNQISSSSSMRIFSENVFVFINLSFFFSQIRSDRLTSTFGEILFFLFDTENLSRRLSDCADYNPYRNYAQYKRRCLQEKKSIDHNNVENITQHGKRSLKYRHVH